MARFYQLLLFVAGVAGLVLTCSVREEIRKVEIRGEGGVIGLEGEGRWNAGFETRRIGLWFSPWYESKKSMSVHGHLSQEWKLDLMSLSSVVFCLSLACLWLSVRILRRTP